MSTETINVTLNNAVFKKIFQGDDGKMYVADLAIDETIPIEPFTVEDIELDITYPEPKRTPTRSEEALEKFKDICNELVTIAMGTDGILYKYTYKGEKGIIKEPFTK